MALSGQRFMFSDSGAIDLRSEIQDSSLWTFSGNIENEGSGAPFCSPDPTF